VGLLDPRDESGAFKGCLRHRRGAELHKPPLRGAEASGLECDARAGIAPTLEAVGVGIHARERIAMIAANALARLSVDTSGGRAFNVRVSIS